VAESKNNRVRAAKLRAKQNKGKALKPEDKRWLDAYTTRTAIATAKAQPSTPRPVDNATTADLTEPQAGPRVVRGPQLALPAVVHETQAIDDTIAPEAYTWTPTVPPPPPGEPEPPLDGAPPPAEGTPLVDAAAPAAAPQGDPAAAAQFAGLVVFITSVGFPAVLELSEGMPIPPELRRLALDHQGELLAQIGAAANRLATKWGLTSVPMADEVIVGGAVAGSVAAWVAVQKRRAKKPAASPTTTPPVAPPAASATEEPEPKKAPQAKLPGALRGVFEDG
jgi:hypothetical protein